MSTEKQGMFTGADGRNLLFTFALVSSLFLLWGLCNGMIDVMDKHFQDELGLSKSQSAWVQFAHYLGYFLMAMPAGWLASKLGYKGGIIAGLLMVSVGGFWFLPATYINEWAHQPETLAQGHSSLTLAFIAFLSGVCVIAAGLTFLETIANPYTTVLGAPRYAAARINLAQSCNAIGWICGPLIGAVYFYSTDAAGKSTGSQTLYIPYVMIAFVVLALSVVFYLAYIPDIKTKDDYHLEDPGITKGRSIWTHPHFTCAVLAQFLYVAAQAGIFSFFINYMVAEPPSMPDVFPAAVNRIVDHTSGFAHTWFSGWFETRTALATDDLKDLPSFVSKLEAQADPVSAFLHEKLSEATQRALPQLPAGATPTRGLRASLVQDLNTAILKETLYDPQRFAGVTLGAATQQLIAEKSPTDTPRLNRMLLADAFPQELAFVDGIRGLTNKGATNLVTFALLFFLAGRFSGSALVRRFSAHKVLGLYGAMNVLLCLVVFLKLGWVSVAAVFLSYFFMSIMFPTIFALGIFGLGARAKNASAYIVMAIMGGAILPKLMGFVADWYDMSRGFIVPGVCFVFIALYGLCWPKLSHAESLQGGSTSGGH